MVCVGLQNLHYTLFPFRFIGMEYPPSQGTKRLYNFIEAELNLALLQLLHELYPYFSFLRGTYLHQFVISCASPWRTVLRLFLQPYRHRLIILSAANIGIEIHYTPEKGYNFQWESEIHPIGRIIIFFLHYFALICSEMGTFAMSKRAKYEWEVL